MIHLGEFKIALETALDGVVTDMNLSQTDNRWKVSAKKCTCWSKDQPVDIELQQTDECIVMDVTQYFPQYSRAVTNSYNYSGEHFPVTTAESFTKAWAENDKWDII